MDKDIESFLKKNYILSLSTCKNNFSYSAPVFYLFFKNSIYFLSDLNTRHSQEILENPNVSASIYKHTKIVKKIKGIQLLGICKMLESTKNILEMPFSNIYNIYKQYLAKFPEAKEISSYLWSIEPYWIKLTNNEIRFGYKKIWSKGENHDLRN